MKVALLVITLSGFFPSAFADDPTSLPLRHYGVVTAEQIYRGGAPDTKEGQEYLEKLRIKTVVDLEASRFWVIEPEETWAKNLGLNFLRYPLYAMPFQLGELQTDVTNTDINNLDDFHMNQVLETIADPEKRPVYVHCMKGDDRTSLVIGLYRILYQKMDKEKAWAEMCSYGFHPYFTALTSYFEKRIGWTPPGCPNVSYNPFK